MRILFVTNYYPPCDYGWGYMQLCEEVADGLAARGHEIAVLTSTYRHGEDPPRPYEVHRLLTIEPDWYSGRSAAWQFFVGRRAREKRAIDHLEQLVSSFRPSTMCIWHDLCMSRGLLYAIETTLRVPVAYYLAAPMPEVGDEYIQYWSDRATRSLAAPLKALLARVALAALEAEGRPHELKYENAMCVSAHIHKRLTSRSLVGAGSQIIYNGVSLDEFEPSRFPGQKHSEGRLRALVAGRICSEKGVHTAVAALGILRARQAAQGVYLTILGDGPADYVENLRRRVHEYGLDAQVSFRSPVPREEMPRMLAGHDVLLLPSEYPEPLARSMQEGMAMGLLVIGTNTGGSGELLVDGETGLVFDPGDADGLAEQFFRAVDDPALCDRLARNAYHMIRERFGIDRTIGKVEQYLAQLAEGAE